MEPLKDNLCTTCKNHNPQGLDDVNDKCYPCVWHKNMKGEFINYEPDLGKILNRKVEDIPVTVEEEEAWKGYAKDAPDMVNHPSHYKSGGIETIDFIKAKLGIEGTVAYCIGNCMKYQTRWKHKNGLEDLKKSQWYLNYAINLIEDTE